MSKGNCDLCDEYRVDLNPYWLEDGRVVKACLPCRKAEMEMAAHCADECWPDCNYCQRGIPKLINNENP